MIQKEIIRLADGWTEIAEMNIDPATRIMAERTANWFYERAGLSEEMSCPTCKRRAETLSEKQYISMFGECDICQDVRLDVILEMKEEQ